MHSRTRVIALSGFARFGGIKVVCKIRFYNLVPWALSGTVKAEVCTMSISELETEAETVRETETV